MNFFKNTFIAIVIFTTLPIDAKIMGGAGRPSPYPVAQPKPVPAPAPAPAKQPAAQIPTFQSLIAYVKNTPSAWDRANARLNTSFVSDIVKQGRAAQLDALQLETLLQTARDMHGIFSGNQQKDSAILQSVANQIAAAIQ